MTKLSIAFLVLLGLGSLRCESQFQDHHLSGGFGNLAPFPGPLPTVNPFEQFIKSMQNDSCREVWCENTDNDNSANIFDDNSFGDEYEEDEYGTKGFWLEPPPDDILFMPPPPMPPSFQAFLNMGNESLKEFIIGEDPEEGYRCNFCKLFSDPIIYSSDSDGSFVYGLPAASKNNESFSSGLYVLVIVSAVVIALALALLVKFKKLRIFPTHWTFLGHQKSSGPGGHSDTRIPVVNEKSPQSIIMDAPLASLGKKSTISTTGKYWKRVPNNGNIFSMEDRRGLRSPYSGSSTGMSEHPYSDAASCTSSPVYAELDPSVAGSMTPTLIGPPGTGAGSVIQSYSPYAFANTYSEVPDNVRTQMNGSMLSDSSTYDNNAAYLSANSQFLGGHGHPPFPTRSLRRLAAQRSALNASLNASNASAGSQVSTPLLGHPYHHQQQQHQLAYNQSPMSMNNSGANAGQFFLTGGRQLKKPRPGHNGQPGQQQQQQQMQTNFGFRTTGRSPMNLYVTHGSDIGHGGHEQMIVNEDMSHPVMNYNAPYYDNSSSSSNRKSSSSSQYTEMPLLNQSGNLHNGSYRISETISNHDLNSASSSSSSGAGTNSTSSAHSTTSLKRPLPPIPNKGHVHL